MDGWKTTFLLGWYIFRGELLNFQGGITCEVRKCEFGWPKLLQCSDVKELQHPCTPVEFCGCTYDLRCMMYITKKTCIYTREPKHHIDDHPNQKSSLEITSQETHAILFTFSGIHRWRQRWVAATAEVVSKQPPRTVHSQKAKDDYDPVY